MFNAFAVGVTISLIDKGSASMGMVTRSLLNGQMAADHLNSRLKARIAAPVEGFGLSDSEGSTEKVIGWFPKGRPPGLSASFRRDKPLAATANLRRSQTEQSIEFTGNIECVQIIATANVLSVDKDLRNTLTTA